MVSPGANSLSIRICGTQSTCLDFASNVVWGPRAGIIFKVDIWSSELNLLVDLGKTKKDRLRVNCKAFLTWVGDGVGGLLGGDSAYRKLTLKHHLDMMQRSMKVVLKVFIFWKLAFQFPGSPERPTGVLKAVFSGKTGPLIFWKP